MTNPHINTALRDWLSEPLTDEHRTAIQIASHSTMLDESPVLREAREIKFRNWAVPNNFTESLDSCRLVENQLDPSLHLRYSLIVQENISDLSLSALIFATPLQRATALVEVLALGVVR